MYVDALVPEDGQSTWSLVTDNERGRYLNGTAENGYTSAPLPFFDPRTTPHPLASLLQAVRLEGDLGRFPEKSYLYATGWPTPSPFTEPYERLSALPDWRTYAVDCGHDVMREAPEELLKIVLSHA